MAYDMMRGSSSNDDGSNWELIANEMVQLKKSVADLKNMIMRVSQNVDRIAYKIK